VADRTAKVERAKVIGRIAYRHLRDAEIIDNVTIGGEDKKMRVFGEDGLLALHAVPWQASPNEHSQIQVRFNGRKVLEIRWDRAGAFKAVHFEPGNGKRC
jgi:hypothetical protein